MNLRLLLRLSLRSSRGARARLLFFAACIASGVAAMVGVDVLVEATEHSLRSNSRELLGGDLELQSRRPLPDVDPYLPQFARAGGRVGLTSLATMAKDVRGHTRLVDARAVTAVRGAYPLVGATVLEPAGSFSTWLDAESVVISPELKRDLGLAVGERIELGGVPFTVRAVWIDGPQAGQFSFNFAPALWLSGAGLSRTKLLGYGDRVRYRTLLTLPQGARDEAHLAALKAALQARVPGAAAFVRIETHDEAQPGLRATLTRVQRYLGLVGLLSLLLGCIGVAQIVSSWVAQSAGETAVLRCLGFRPREVLWFYLLHVALIALLGSALGGALGLLLPPFMAQAFPELLSASASWATIWPAIVRGLLVGSAVSLLFCLPPLITLLRVTPARVLRSTAEPLPMPRWVRLAAVSSVIVGVYAAAYDRVRDAVHAFWFVCFVLLLGGLLSGAAWLLQRLAAVVPRQRIAPELWQGIAALARPGAGTLSSVVSLGLGTLVVLSIALAEDVVGSELAQILPANAPSVFLADVQTDQWAEIKRLAQSYHAHNVQSAPVVMARLRHIDGEPVAQRVAAVRADADKAGTRAEWVYTREQRITIREHQGAGNRLVAGSWWSLSQRPELSLEEGFAKELGVGVGATLGFDVQGVPLDFVVSSLRKVEWRSFAPNFFLVAEPGTLDDAPQFRIAALRLSAEREQAFQDALAKAHPTVTVVRVRAMVQRVGALLSQLAAGVRLLGYFAILTGLVILIGSVASTQLQRARQVALLKALGVTRLRIVAMFALEYGLRGAAAGLLGAGFAYVLVLAFARQVLELQSSPSVGLSLFGVLATVALSIAGGLLASVRALWVSPQHVLRG